MKYIAIKNYTTFGNIASISIYEEKCSKFIALVYTEEDAELILNKLNTKKYVLELVSDVMKMKERKFFIFNPYNYINCDHYITTPMIHNALSFDNINDAEFVKKNLVGNLACYWKIVEVE